MEPHAFEAALLADGYSAETKTLPSFPTNSQHTHPFDVRGLILDGSFTLTTAEATRTFIAGEVFSLPAGHPHTEATGPNGARYIVGRRHKDNAS